MRYHLLDKYETRSASYKSYPFIPYWNEENPMKEEWEILVEKTFKKTNESSGISININLPFCESRCTFCAFSPYVTKNHEHETPYINNLIKEYQNYLSIFNNKPTIKRIHIGGGTPTFFSPSNLKTLIEFIATHSNLDKEAEFSFEINANTTTLEHLFVLKNFGVTTLILGIQDFDPEIQNTINKIQTQESVNGFIQTARFVGFENISFDLALGLPGQSRKSLLNTIYKIMELKPERINIFEYNHCPEKCAPQKKYENQLPPKPEIKVLFALAKEMLKEIGYIELGMDRFVLKTDCLYTAFKNKSIYFTRFGYSKHDTPLTIGLGVNALSDCHYAFVKNTSKLGDYYKSIDEKKCAIEKAYFLSKKDMLIHKHISNLQGRLKTSWNPKEEWHPVLNKAIEKLRTFEKDNLLKINAGGIKIKNAGIGFIMDICNTIDARLWKKELNEIQSN